MSLASLVRPLPLSAGHHLSLGEAARLGVRPLDSDGLHVSRGTAVRTDGGCSTGRFVGVLPSGVVMVSYSGENFDNACAIFDTTCAAKALRRATGCGFEPDARHRGGAL